MLLWKFNYASHGSSLVRLLPVSPISGTDSDCDWEASPQRHPHKTDTVSVSEIFGDSERPLHVPIFNFLKTFLYDHM